ncbi:MAG: hypothetical protein HUJ54_05170 [Erysipelotrichaceae bacterium]|nr:hypothetical protein [Erysipelotrichaceae bacterium]
MSKKNRKKITDDQAMRERQKASMKSMYFNRFLMVRYMLALFFFSNFFWTLFSWGNPIGYFGAFMTAFGLLPMYETFKMYGQTKPVYKFTKLYFWVQWVTTMIMMVLCFTSCKFIFPFLNMDNSASRPTAFVISAIGFVCATLVVRRLNQIDKGTDKQYKRIQYFETKYRLHI